MYRIDRNFVKIKKKDSFYASVELEKGKFEKANIQFLLTNFIIFQDIKRGLWPRGF